STPAEPGARREQHEDHHRQNEPAPARAWRACLAVDAKLSEQLGGIYIALPVHRTSVCHNSLRQLGGLGIHPEGLPVMAVEIVEAPAVHEPMVLWLHGMAAAGGDGLLHQLVDFSPALARKRKEPLGAPVRVADLARGEGLEE